MVMRWDCCSRNCLAGSATKVREQHGSCGSRVWQSGNFVMTIFISLPMIFQVVMLSSQFKNKVSETLVNHFAFESSKPFTESSFSIDPDEKIASFSI